MDAKVGKFRLFEANSYEYALVISRNNFLSFAIAYVRISIITFHDTFHDQLGTIGRSRKNEKRSHFTFPRSTRYRVAVLLSTFIRHLSTFASIAVPRQSLYLLSFQFLSEKRTGLDIVDRGPL